MTGPLTYSIEEAAARLGGPFTVDWLKARIKTRQVRFLKVGAGTGQGGRVGFSEAQLAEIVAQFTVEPAPAGSVAAPVTRRRAS